MLNRRVPSISQYSDHTRHCVRHSCRPPRHTRCACPDLQLTLRANPSPPPPAVRAAVESEREHHERAC